MTDAFTTAVERFAERTSPTKGYGIAGDPVVRYRLLEPADRSTSAAHPLVIFLHGAGERGGDNRLQLRYLPEYLASDEGRRRYPCFALVPQCPADDRWVDVDWSRPDSLPAATATRAMRSVRAIGSDLLAALPIDRSRIYLTGISMGGFGAWYLAEAIGAERFAAVAPICGGGNPSGAAVLKETPIWAVHGDRDEAVSVEHSRRMIEAIKQAGGAPRYTELAGVGHDSWTPAYDPAFGLLDWMFQQRK
jgi:predicted peptidase